MEYEEEKHGPKVRYAFDHKGKLVFVVIEKENGSGMCFSKEEFISISESFNSFLDRYKEYRNGHSNSKG